jgi:hypothetical protein
MKEVNPKMFTPLLVLDYEFFHRAFANPCTSKASHTMGYGMGPGGRAKFAENLRASSFD